MALLHESDRPAKPRAFEARLREVGARHYHDKHPFHRAMHDGLLTQDQLRAWIANRYYYQKIIPVKDAVILSKLPSREHRRLWIQRIIDHDGTLADGGGGLELWFALAQSAGLEVDDVKSERHVLAGTRRAADSYVDFVRTSDWVTAVASSLTELFAPDLMAERIHVLRIKYPWLSHDGLEYFRRRLSLARRDADYALRWVIQEARSAPEQDACVAALEFKCGVLWSLLDGIQQAHGAGRPQ